MENDNVFIFKFDLELFEEYLSKNISNLDIFNESGEIISIFLNHSLMLRYYKEFFTDMLLIQEDRDISFIPIAIDIKECILLEPKAIVDFNLGAQMQFESIIISLEDGSEEEFILFQIPKNLIEVALMDSSN